MRIIAEADDQWQVNKRVVVRWRELSRVELEIKQGSVSDGYVVLSEDDLKQFATDILTFLNITRWNEGR